MAPKSCPPPRPTPKSTARKPIPPRCATSNLKTASSSSTSQDSFDARPPPSSASYTSSSGFPSKDTGIVNSDHELRRKYLATASRREITAGEEVREGCAVNAELTTVGISSCKAEDGTLDMPKSRIVEGDRAEIEGNMDGRTSVEGEIGVGVEVGDDARPEVKGESGDGAVAEVDKGASRNKKMVKKIRIVKKIVKRRVPKRVVKKGSLENEEMERLENVGYPIEGNENNLEFGKNEVDSLEAERVDSNGVVCMETENSKTNDSVALEVANTGLEDTKVETMESRELCVVSMMRNPSEILVVEENDGKESERIEDQFGNQNVQFVDPIKGDLVEDQNAGLANEMEGKGEDLVKEIIENNDVGLNGGSALGEEMGTAEGQGEEAVKEIVENNDVEFSGVAALSGEMEALEGHGKEAVKEVVENNDVKFSGGVASSGEMEGLVEEEEELVKKDIVEKNDAGFDKEVPVSGKLEALERKNRRRTEIFLGGLDKDAKEEDIRNVFEQTGKVMEVRLVMDGNTKKNKGFAFVRFALAADAKIALEKYSTVKICGKQCCAQPVEGSDTIFLGNINRKWKNEDVVKLLNNTGIKKIDKVTVIANPSNLEQNRGFAFLKFETSKDAQIAFSQLQKHDVFVNKMKIKVAWAQPLVEPEEEEMLKVKAVYAEYLPPSWDDKKVTDLFKRFGEVESITFSKNLPSSKRKDFAFVNYTRREAALACIEAFGHEQLDDEGSKLKVKVSLAKPNRKDKQMKRFSTTTGSELEKKKRKVSQCLAITKVEEPRKKGKPSSSNLDGVRDNKMASTTEELLQLLRQQALVGQTRPGSSTRNYHYGSHGNERPITALGTHSLLSDPRGFPRTHLEIPHLYGSPSAYSRHVGMASLPNSQQPWTNVTLKSSNVFEDDPHVMMRERANYYGHGDIYRSY